MEGGEDGYPPSLSCHSQQADERTLAATTYSTLEVGRCLESWLADVTSEKTMKAVKRIQALFNKTRESTHGVSIQQFVDYMQPGVRGVCD